MINTSTMGKFKQPHIGLYSPKDRLFQKTLSYEKVSLTWHPVMVFKYLGVRTNEYPDITDIQDTILLENPDRAYDTTSIKINAWMEFLPESQFDLGRFGIINPLGNTMQFRFHINSFEQDGLGRYIVVNDIIEVPFWEQNLNKSYWEVTDIDKKTEFEHFYVIVTAEPMESKQETAEIANKNDNVSLLDSLAVSIEADQDSVFSEGLLNVEPSLYVTRGYFADDYIDTIDPLILTDEKTRKDYDPRPSDNADFLDDPSKVVF